MAAGAACCLGAIIQEDGLEKAEAAGSAYKHRSSHTAARARGVWSVRYARFHIRNGLINTINGLSRIAVVGNTAFIVDAHGRTIAVDPNPYGVTIVPSSIPASNTPGTLKAGDILVSNIGDNDTVAVAHL